MGNVQETSTTDDAASSYAKHHRIDNIQMLRGLAALGVVIFHAQEMLQFNKSSYIPDALIGAAGVDVFFVLSGFVMIHSSRRMFGQRFSSFRFLRDRAARIIPAYWIVSFFFFLFILLFEDARGNAFFLTKELLRSIVFLEAANHQYPIVPVGWTLNFEVVFYLLFSLFVCWSKTVTLIGVTSSFVALIALNPVLPDRLTTFGTPLALEFVSGMFIAEIFLRGWRLRNAHALVVSGVGLLVLLALPRPDENWWWHHGVAWGPSAVAIVFAITLARTRYAGTLPDLLTSIGNVSYSLYLTHFVVFALVEHVMHGVRIDDKLIGTAYFFGLVALSMIVAYRFHDLVDMPIYRALKRRRDAG